MKLIGFLLIHQTYSNACSGLTEDTNGKNASSKHTDLIYLLTYTDRHRHNPGHSDSIEILPSAPHASLMHFWAAKSSNVPLSPVVVSTAFEKFQ